MKLEYEHTEFSKALLAGVFAGIAAAVISITFNGYFRLASGYNLSYFINVPSLSFVLIIMLTCVGCVYYLFMHNFKNGSTLFILLSLVISAILIYLTLQIDRTGDIPSNIKFRELLIGVIVIAELCVAWGIPFLFKHDELL